MALGACASGSYDLGMRNIEIIIFATFALRKMCRKCLLELRPDRGSTCLDTGVFVLNFGGCAECGKRDFPKAADEESTAQSDEDGGEEDGDDSYEEEVTYKHKCKHCEHLIAEHYYSFTVDDGRQNFIM